jgi:hypothetical protein
VADNFEYFNLNDIDPTFHAIETGIYGFRVNKMEYKTVVPKSGKNQGVEVPLIQGNFTVINHDQFSGRRLRHTFWLTNTFDQKSLRRLMDATGILQEPGEPLSAYVERFSAAEPPAEFKTYVVKVTKEEDPLTGKPGEDNEMKWNNVQPIN